VIFALRRDSGGDVLLDQSFTVDGYLGWRDVDAAKADIAARCAQRELALTWTTPISAHARGSDGAVVQVWLLVKRTGAGHVKAEP
jgi:hypothetical protein